MPKALWICSSLLFLASCVSMPKNLQTENLISPPSVESSVAKSLQTPFFFEGDWPKESWWEIFHSDQLDRLIALALEKNPTIEAVEKRISFAKETAVVTRSKLFPLLFFDMDESWEYLSHHGLYRAFNPQLPINANLVDLTLSFTYEFDFWGKNKNLYRAALGREKAEEAEAAQVKLITTTAVAQAFFALKTNLIRQALYEQLVSVRKAATELQDQLQENALLSKLPPLLSEEGFLEAEKLLLTVQEEIATDKHLLNILVGLSPDAPLEADASMPALPQTLALPSNLSLDLLARRPDLMAQIWRVEAMAHEVGAAKADFYPNINLTAFAGLESVLYSLLFNAKSETAGLQPAIHLPIFTAGAIRANIQAKKAAFDEAVFEYNNLLLRSSKEVADLLIIVETVFKQKHKQYKIVGNAKSRYELTALRQKNGLDNQLENYAYQEALILKELEDAALLYNQYLSTIKLIKALGGGYLSEYSIPLRAGES